MSIQTKLHRFCVLALFGALCGIIAAPASLASQIVTTLQEGQTGTPTPTSTRSGPFVFSPDGPLIFDLPTPPPFRAGPISVQQLSPLEKSYLAAVKIMGCAQVGADECTVSEGSGTIVHPNGLILTALHVVVEDRNNSSSPTLPEVGIGVIASVETQSAVLQYRAKVVAIDEKLDLALLKIVQSPEDQELNLPTLPVDSITYGEFRNAALKVIGFPQGEMGLKGPSVDFFGLHGTAVEVQAQFVGVGFSGSPLLVQKGDRYHIGGVAFYRTEDGLVLVQPMQRVNHLRWLDPPVPLVWGQEVQVKPFNFNEMAGLRLSANVHVIDLMGRTLRMQAVAFESDDRPWPSATDPLTFQQTFEAVRFVDVVPLDLSISLANTDPIPDHLRFSFQVWDDSESRLLWTGDTYYSPPSVTATPTPILTPTLTPAPTATATTVDATPTRAPTRARPTGTPSPTPTRTATATATLDRAATAMVEASVTAHIRSTATALALTREAVKATPTPTATVPATPTPVLSSDERLRNRMLEEMRRSSIRNSYPQQSEWFVDGIIAHLDEFQLPTLGITETTMRSALDRNGVGDRLNAIVHEVMGDPGASPFRQLIYRLIQGRQGRLTDSEQHALYSYFTRPESPSVWRDNIDGVIGAVNRESFLWP